MRDKAVTEAFRVAKKKKEGYRAPSFIPDRACKRINKKEVIEDAPL
jgi:hypothetical protein